MPLKVAFMAYNAWATNVYFRQLLKDNAEQIATCNSAIGWAVLKDGTEIKRIYPGAEMHGLHFDQVIIADDRRLNITQRRAELRELARTLCHSNVPEKYQFQIYDIDEEAPT